MRSERDKASSGDWGGVRPYQMLPELEATRRDEACRSVGGLVTHMYKLASALECGPSEMVCQVQVLRPKPRTALTCSWRR